VQPLNFHSFNVPVYTWQLFRNHAVRDDPRRRRYQKKLPLRQPMERTLRCGALFTRTRGRVVTGTGRRGRKPVAEHESAAVGRQPPRIHLGELDRLNSARRRPLRDTRVTHGVQGALCEDQIGNDQLRAISNPGILSRRLLSNYLPESSALRYSLNLQYRTPARSYRCHSGHTPYHPRRCCIHVVWCSEVL